LSDNIFFKNDSGVADQFFDNCGFEVGFDASQSSGRILGVVVDCKEKTVNVTDKLRTQITSSVLDKSCRIVDIFRLFGLIAFASRVLHKGVDRISPDYPSSQAQSNDTITRFQQQRNTIQQ
jgi:hypothetical protein